MKGLAELDDIFGRGLRRDEARRRDESQRYLTAPHEWGFKTPYPSQTPFYGV